jgi:hypothetical protein
MRDSSKWEGVSGEEGMEGCSDSRVCEVWVSITVSSVSHDPSLIKSCVPVEFGSSYFK